MLFFILKILLTYFFVSEMEGMPPAYIVVDMSWEDPDDDLNDLANKKENNDKIKEKFDKNENSLDNQNENKIQEFIQNYWRKNTSPYSHRYRSVFDIHL